MKAAFRFMFTIVGGFYGLLAFYVTGMMWTTVLHFSGTMFIVLLFITNVLDALIAPGMEKERAENGIPELIDWEDK